MSRFQGGISIAELAYVGVRRPLLKWALRRAALAQAGIVVRAGVRITGFAGQDGRVVAVCTDDGDVTADRRGSGSGRRRQACGQGTRSHACSSRYPISSRGVRTGRQPVGVLTSREVEVLRLVASGDTNKEIAAALVISEHTVARHVQTMLHKLDCSSRSGLAAFAVEHDLTRNTTGQK